MQRFSEKKKVFLLPPCQGDKKKKKNTLRNPLAKGSRDRPLWALIRKPEWLIFQRETVYILRQLSFILIIFKGSEAPLKSYCRVEASFSFPSMLIQLIKMH